VPGLFFLLVGLWLWFTQWENATWKRLSWIGVLFGLAMVTKYQYLLFLIPMLGLSWVLNMVYYRGTSHRHFLVPAVAAGLLFAVWQGITIRYLGPATMLENLAMLRASAEGAAFTIDPVRISATLADLKSRSAYLTVLFPSLVYGFLISLPRTRDAQKWSTLFLMVALNLGWYVVASIGWIRYAFLGLVFTSLFTARLFSELTEGFKLDVHWSGISETWQSMQERQTILKLVLLGWLVYLILLPLAKTTTEIAFPAPASAQEMADHLNKTVPVAALIETWEPEIGFLTDHNYHYPPNRLLAVAIAQVYSNGEPVHNSYDFVQTERPEYVLLGTFAKRTDMYPLDELQGEYELIQTFGDYDLYQRVEK
jgi:hypothetical protein